MKNELSKADALLLEELKNLNTAYRSGESPVSDEEYDIMVSDFASRNPNHDFVLSIEPNDVPVNRKEKLPIDMRSLDKVQSIEELNKWFKKCGIKPTDIVALGPKWDGLSLLDNIPYGAAWTRGGETNEGMKSDGHLALIEDVKKVRKLNKKNDNIEFSGGEVLISRKNFNEQWKGKINPKTGEVYKTARGVMSGLMRNDTPSKKMQFVDYIRYFSPELEHLPFDEYIKKINSLNTVKHPIELIKASDITSDIMDKLYKSWSVNYEIDGIVVVVVDSIRRQELGRHKKTGNPMYSVAYKGDFEERLETKVKGVTCKVSKRGLLKPTVPLESVILSGAEIENPTGYNMKWIFDNNIAKGSTVVVKRSGEVIPKIIKTIDFNEENVKDLAEELSCCPACGATTLWNDSYVELVCTNADCKGKKLAEAVSFFEIMKFEDFGEGAIEKLFNSGCTDVFQMINISDNDFLKIDGLGDASLVNFRSQCIDKFQNDGISLAVLMHSSNKFPGLGSTKLQLILDNMYASDEAIREAICAGTGDYYVGNEYEICPASTKGLGEKTIAAFVDNFEDFCDWMIDFNIEISNIRTVVQEASGETCVGMAVCFSGFRDDALEAFIKGEGGEVKKAYSKKVTHLIVADPNASTSKIVKAKDDGCQVLTTDQFKNL